MTNEELRIEIAKRKGWTKLTARRGLNTCGVRPGDLDMHWTDLPNWPESIADAWTLVEEMKARPGCLGIELECGDTPPANWKCATYWLENGVTTSDGGQFDDAAPRAISLAWLAATSGEAGEDK